jgi:hypothetical protein
MVQSRPSGKPTMVTRDGYLPRWHSLSLLINGVPQVCRRRCCGHVCLLR